MASHAATTGLEPRGVPGRGFKKLSGTSVGRRSASWPISSTRCASDSPMPISAPQQSSMPWSTTSRHVSARSSQVWVVTTSPKKDRAVSRLWL